MSFHPPTSKFNHQRVVTTHWWLFISSAPSYLQLQPPTSLYDSLVGSPCLLASPHPLPTTNESLRLVGGFSSPLHPPTTTNELLRLVGGLSSSFPHLHTCCQPPTSHCDLLVAFHRLCTLQPPTSLYSSLVGSHRRFTLSTPAATHQRVIVTRWWLSSSPPPTTCNSNHQRVFMTC